MTALKDYGRYALLKKLATGGMAEVFLARQKGVEGFEKLCVIKRILPHLADDAEFVNMFLNEARIAARFTHPNIAQIFDLGKEEGTYFIAMEYVHGEDLGRIMRQAWQAGTWIPLPVALRIIAQSCEGLFYAHSKTDERGQPLKVVHRDVSPQNVLVAFEGNAKIVDFGIARAADQVSTTRSGAIKGKFAYMSPEQASGKPLDARSDQFAIGLVLYELLTGVRPFKRDSDILTLKAAVDCEIPEPSQVADVPADLDPIVMRALAKVADDRYPDTRGFQLAVESFIVQRGWTVTSAHVSEFMRQLFAERLKHEERTGEPLVHSSESVTGIPAAASGSFPLPKRVPTRPDLLVGNAGDGPPALNPEAVAAASSPMPAVEPEKPGWSSQAVLPATGARRRAGTSERPSLVPATGRRSSAIRPAVPNSPAAETRVRGPEPAPPPAEPERPRRRSGIRRAALAEPLREPSAEPAPEPAPPPPARAHTGERRRRSVLHMNEAEVAEQEAARAEAVRPTRIPLGGTDDDDPEEAPTRAEPRRESDEKDKKPFPRWPLYLLLATFVVGISLVPSVRIQVMRILQLSSGEEPVGADMSKTALFLDSNVPVDVYLGSKKLGTTPLENALVQEGELTLRLVNPTLGVERTIRLNAKGSTLRHKETFVMGRVRFRAERDCDVYIQGARVARANGPPLDYYEGTWEAECRSEALALSGRTRFTIAKDRGKVADVYFKLAAMPDRE